MLQICKTKQTLYNPNEDIIDHDNAYTNLVNSVHTLQRHRAKSDINKGW